MGNRVNPADWKLRARVFAQRLWQPTSACLTCMPGSWGNVLSGVHWSIALQTGITTGLVAVALSFTPLRGLFRNRYGNALVVGVLTALADAFVHVDHYSGWHAEALLTGTVSGLLAVAGSFATEFAVRRLRALRARRPA
jgi:ABC-type thiamin/hydroxymethylpyrimidine transport system permease subunit